MKLTISVIKADIGCIGGQRNREESGFVRRRTGPAQRLLFLQRVRHRTGGGRT